MKQEFIFIGPPGSGKGTQTKMLSQKLNLPHIDTGSLLREVIASNSEEGKIAASFIDKGNLVPVELVSKIIKNRLLQKDCKDGFILDGYPRSSEQALALDEILKEVNEGENIIPKVIYFEIDKKHLIERLVNRRSCPKCGSIFNLKTMKLENEKICPKCNVELVRRRDDTEEVANKRFVTYFNETEPVIDIYKSREWLTKINAEGDINTVSEELLEKIK